MWKCKKCENVNIDEHNVWQHFSPTLKKLLTDRNDLIEECTRKRNLMIDMADIEKQIQETAFEIKMDVRARNQNENVSEITDMGGLAKLERKLRRLKDERFRRRSIAAGYGSFIYCMSHIDSSINDFDMGVFNETVKRILVGINHNFSYEFLDGTILGAVW